MHRVLSWTHHLKQDMSVLKAENIRMAKREKRSIQGKIKLENQPRKVIVSMVSVFSLRRMVMLNICDHVFAVSMYLFLFSCYQNGRKDCCLKYHYQICQVVRISIVGTENDHDYGSTQKLWKTWSCMSQRTNHAKRRG